MRKRFLVYLGLILLLSGCDSVEWSTIFQSSTAIPGVRETEITAPTALATTTAEPVEPTELPSVSGPMHIKIWVPPHMDPAVDSPPGKLLQSRLDQFSRQNDGLVIDVRVKSITGAGGLLDSLAATSAAAPLALPDLVALPRDSLESAALKGMLQPVGNLENPVDDTGWYEYASQLVRVQDTAYGFPIVGDALVMVYRTSVIQEPPATWSEILDQTTPFVFPAADQRALFPLALYASQDGRLRDEDGRPFLDADYLTKVLTLFASAEERGVMPYWLTQYQDDEQVWKAYLDKEADLVVAWLSDFLRDMPEESGFALLPLEDEQNYTLADGWVWALASIQVENHDIRAELAKFLSEPRFAQAYAEALGYLSPIEPSLDPSFTSSQVATLDQVAQSARLIPSTDILISLGHPVQQAVMQVLKNQVEPILAAQEAVEALTSP